MERKIDYRKFGFLPYQAAWLEDTSQIKLYEKSRRIGARLGFLHRAHQHKTICGFKVSKFMFWYSQTPSQMA